ncbi:helix-turn-helix transcriptional regulator [Microbacterium oryzae]|uniref:helix-turn-helix domain-containing protein n=1 Tax=Microbacterium oryzae TaxID=743009 RepID=UPI0025AF9071|nr:helix-turn-helix transcriptional regulator [Microbacterium oryzae]MDN3311778.1 helix-turn-helix transcriptional regulator [Microbacterium oryzae]
MPITEALRDARRLSGKNLRDIATLSGVGVPNLSAIENGRRDPKTSTTERIASALGLEPILVPLGGRCTVAAAAAAIRDADRVGDDERAYRSFIQLNNDLASADGVDKVLLSASQPASITPEWDAALAGLVEWHLHEAKLPAPRWTSQIRGDRSWRWAPWPAIRVVAARPDHVPGPLAERGIWIEDGELESA